MALSIGAASRLNTWKLCWAAELTQCPGFYTSHSHDGRRLCFCLHYLKQLDDAGMGRQGGKAACWLPN